MQERECRIGQSEMKGVVPCYSAVRAELGCWAGSCDTDVVISRFRRVSLQTTKGSTLLMLHLTPVYYYIDNAGGRSIRTHDEPQSGSYPHIIPSSCLVTVFSPDFSYVPSYYYSTGVVLVAWQDRGETWSSRVTCHCCA